MAKQQSISVQARTSAARADVYALLIDPSTWTRWTPFDSVTVLEAGSDGPGGTGSVKETRYRGLGGRERVLSVTHDRQLSYALEKGVFTPSLRDYVAVVDLTDAGDGTVIDWRSTFFARFPGAGWLPRRLLTDFLGRCAEGLAAEAAGKVAGTP